MKILVSDYRVRRDYSREKSMLAEFLPGAVLESYRYAGDRRKLIEKLRGADGLLTCFLPVDREALSRVPGLKMISVDAVGYGNIDVEAAREFRVSVCTLGDYCTEEVADHTLALILALEKSLKLYAGQIDREHRYSVWAAPRRHRLSLQTLAVFGYGRIGRAVAKRARAFGLHVLAVTRHPERIGSAEDGVAFVSAEEALKTADIVSNHMNQTPENENYFNFEKFSQMKPGALFINVSRGAGVDEKDLLRALDSKTIAGAGLDVLRDADPDLAANPLVGRENVILTPHSAFCSAESVEYLQTVPMMNIIHYFKGETDKISRIIC